MFYKKLLLLMISVSCVMFLVGLIGCKATTSTSSSTKTLTSTSPATTSITLSLKGPTTTPVGPIAYAITTGPDGNLWFTEENQT